MARISIYLHETFQVYSRLVLSLIACMIVFIYQSKTFQFFPFFIATISMFFSLLYYRVCDEFKDEETDKKYFPNRPFPSGRVKKEDLKFLLYFSGGAILIVNLLQPATFLFGFLLFFYCVLMQKWFFVPKLLENNRLLAFLTHSPYAIVLNIFIVAVFVNGDTSVLFSPQNIALIICLSLPGFHWEIVRKTFTEEREGYETYSYLLGYKGALLFSILYLIIPIASAYWLISGLPLYFLVILSLSYLIYLLFLALTNRKSILELRLLAEVITSAFMLAILVGGFIQ